MGTPTHKTQRQTNAAPKSRKPTASNPSCILYNIATHKLVYIWWEQRCTHHGLIYSKVNFSSWSDATLSKCRVTMICYIII